MNDIDNAATGNVASDPSAPPQGGETPASQPAPVDTTVSPEPEPDAATKAEQAQDRKASRAFASLRRQNAELMRELGRQQGLREATTPPAEKAGPPKQSDYNNFDDYMAAVVAHAGETAVAKAAKQFGGGGNDPERASQESGRAFWDAATKEAKEKGITGFAEAAEAIKSGELVTSPAMSHYVIEEADNKAALVAWLADNPDDSERIAKLDPVKAGAALAKVDASLGQKPRQVSKAPAPVPQPTGGGTAPQSIDRMSYEDLKKQVAKWGRG